MVCVAASAELPIGNSAGRRHDVVQAIFTASSEFAATIACLHPLASFEASKRVPRLTPAAPSISAAAMPRPSNSPPVSTTGIGETASTPAVASISAVTVEDASAYQPLYAVRRGNAAGTRKLQVKSAGTWRGRSIARFTSKRDHYVGRGCCADKKRTELPPPHSITSSARASSVGGIVMPSAFAVLRLMTSSNFIGCSTGSSPGLTPLRILSTYPAPRRQRSARSGE